MSSRKLPYPPPIDHLVCFRVTIFIHTTTPPPQQETTREKSIAGENTAITWMQEEDRNL
jgi:hypothetical protein